jgi:putative heme-binding domain-containing protein
VFDKVLAENWTKEQERNIADVSLAITNSSAASFLVAHLKRTAEPRDFTENALKHAARFLPADRIDDLASLAQENFRGDVDLQSSLFKSINDGLKQRGTPLSAKTKTWGAGLVGELLSSIERADNNWFAASESTAANPWVVQRRKCADGKNADFLCTLPSGEQTTGILRSKNFSAPAQLTFWMAGHDGFPDKPLQKKNFVVLKDAASSDVLIRAPAPRNDTAQKVTWNLSAHTGQQVFLELVDGDTAGAYAWLAVGRFDPAVAPLPKLTPKLVDERVDSAAQIALTTHDSSLEPRLARAMNVNCGFDARASVATALLAMNAQKYVAASSALLSDVAAPEASRVKLAQSIADANTDDARTAVLDVIRRSPERSQPKLALALAGSRSGADALLKDVEAGKIPARVLQNQNLKAKLIASKADNVESRIVKLTSNLTPLNEEIQKIIDARARAFRPGRASATTGAGVFEKNCAACHQLDGKGALVGPQLDGVGARGAERIMEDILDPNRNVDNAFRTTMFVLNDEDVVSGLFRREEGELVVYADSTGKELTVPKKNIKERRQGELSLMPENFADTIPANDFNDLIAFLLTKTGAKK